MRPGAVILLAGLATLAACGGERLRPGPPSLELQVPVGNVVTSPDTFFVRVYVHDDNGLDSVVVSFLDQVRDIFVFNETDVVDGVFFVVPESLPVGEVLEVAGWARDIGGELTTTTTSVTVASDSVGVR